MHDKFEIGIAAQRKPKAIQRTIMENEKICLTHSFQGKNNIKKTIPITIAKNLLLIKVLKILSEL